MLGNDVRADLRELQVAHADRAEHDPEVQLPARGVGGRHPSVHRFLDREPPVGLGGGERDSIHGAAERLAGDGRDALVVDVDERAARVEEDRLQRAARKRSTAAS